MTDLAYHITNVSNVKEIYEEGDNTDFLISNPGRELVPGSIRLVGDSYVTNNTSFVADGEGNLNRVMYDPLIGAHSFVDSVSTSCSNLGTIENIRLYQRYVATKARASIAPSDLYNSVYTPEQRTPSYEHANLLLKGYTVDPALEEYDADSSRDMDFCIKPDICLNSPLQGEFINLDKTGDIKISIVVSRSVYSLFGDPLIGSTKAIQLKNLRLMYSTVAAVGPAKPIQLRIENDLKQSIQSSNAIITTKDDIVANACFISFIRQRDENNALKNGMECQRLPDTEEVEYTWNDSLNTPFKYELESEGEFVGNFIKAVTYSMDSENTASQNTLASNDGWGIGLYFGSYINLAKSKLAVRIRSAVSNADPYVAYLFFTGVYTI